MCTCFSSNFSSTTSALFSAWMYRSPPWHYWSSPAVKGPGSACRAWLPDSRAKRGGLSWPSAVSVHARTEPRTGAGTGETNRRVKSCRLVRASKKMVRMTWPGGDPEIPRNNVTFYGEHANTTTRYSPNKGACLLFSVFRATCYSATPRSALPIALAVSAPDRPRRPS